jgi:hypothetical protein
MSHLITEIASKLPVGEKDETGRWTYDSKVALVQRILLYGNIRKACEETKIPFETYNLWRGQDWFPVLVEEIKEQQKAEFANKLDNVIAVGLDIVMDRMQNGDYILNNKTGEVTRKPVGVRDATRVVTEILGKKLVIQKDDNQEKVQKETVNETLKTLAAEFAKFNRKISKNNAETIEYVEVNDAVHDERKEGL